MACTTPWELSDASTCLAVLGTADLSPFESSYIAIPANYGRKASSRIFLPVYSSSPLGSRNSSITRAVIYQHGLTGNANSYFCAGLESALESQSALGTTLVVAPWFGNASVSGDCWGKGSPEWASLFFNTANWLYGGNNSPGPAGTNPPTRFGTAFDGLDALIAALLDQAKFPSLRTVVFAGFSAGAQLAQRYAWAAHSLPPAVRVIVSDPSSFLYFDPGRPAATCRPLGDSGPNATCSSWPAPDEAQCPGYDDYKYGIAGGLNTTLYTAPLASDPVALAAQVAAYPLRDVRYLFGTHDVCACNTPGYANPGGCFDAAAGCAPNAAGGPGCCDTLPDSSNNAEAHGCADELQGSNRLQRGLLYTAYLKERAFPASPPPPVALFDAAHSSEACYASAAFKQWAYGDAQ